MMFVYFQTQRVLPVLKGNIWRIFYLFSLVFLALTSQSIQAQTINFGSSDLQGVTLDNPTSLQFGPDGRLYVAQQDGTIKILTIARDNAIAGSGTYTVSSIETLDVVKNEVPNHNDDGVFNPTDQRQVTGILVTGTAEHPVLYVTSSDWRIAVEEDSGLDTNSGVLSRLTWNGSQWEKVDLVRGFPRCEENHAINGLTIDKSQNIIYLMIGGSTNKGAPSNNFATTPEYYLSAALLTIDLNQLDAMPVYTDTRTNTQFVYDLPTLNDPTRPDIDKTNPNFPYPAGHPLRNAVIDQGDPFGGNDGLNQAFPEIGGPVQIYSPGYRNSYDIVLTTKGRLYSAANGPNSNWGGTPKIYTADGTFKGTGNSVFNAAAGNYCTCEISETSSGGHNDALQYITGPGFYGGHPAPIRAFPDRAGIYLYEKVGENWEQQGLYQFFDLLSGVQGYFKNSFGPSDFPNNPIECDYSVTEGAIDLVNGTTNGIVEYTATNFDGAMTGDILTVTWGKKVNRYKLNEAGDQAIIKDNEFFSGFASQVLDITAQGDNDIFPGTIWVASYSSEKITAFEPADFIDCPLPGENGYDPQADNDGDGFTNDDEFTNGTNLCSGASFPSDNDGDGISDLLDPDDDNDGILDVNDPFALDNQNGLATNLPVIYPFWNNDPGTGLFGLGFTGLMVNGSKDYLSQFDENNLAAGGASGKLTVERVSTGDASSTNNQDYGFQFGINVDNTTNPFTVHTKLESPIFDGQTPTDFQSQGIQIGLGDQDNYLKVVITANGGQGGVSAVLETNGNPTSYAILVPDLLSASSVDFYISVNPGTLTAQCYVSLDRGLSIIPVGSTFSIPASWLSATDNQGLAVGIISTSQGAGVPFSATWDFIDVTEDLDATPLTNITSIVDFGNLAFGSGVTSQDLELKNQGGPSSGGLEITAINFFGPNANEFSFNASLPIELSPGITRTLKLNFTPGATGIKSANVEITYNNGEKLSVPITASVGEQPVVLYRVNAGGNEIIASDGLVNWGKDTKSTPSPYLVHDSGQLTSGFSIIGTTSDIPTTTPTSIFNSERYDQGALPDMEWAFPANVQGTYEIRLYMVDGFEGTDQPGERYFDIEIEDDLVENDLDLVETFGNKVGGFRKYIVPISDGTINIRFIQGMEKPLINGIEILGPSPSENPIVINTIADQMSIDGNASTITVLASGGTNGENFTYAANGLPPGLDIESTNGQIFGNIDSTASSGGPNNDGVYNVIITVSKPSDNPVSINFTWTVLSTQSGNVTLYRVNTGGNKITAEDGGIDWEADTNNNPSPYLVNQTAHGTSAFNPTKILGLHPSVPSYTPISIYETERWDDNPAPVLEYAFPVEEAGEYAVRLYFGDMLKFSQNPGQRLFDVEIEGTTIETDLDLIAAFGDQIGGYRNYLVNITDGVINIKLLHSGALDPMINGIEIISISDIAPPIVATIPNQVSVEGEEISLAVQASGGDANEAYTYSASGLPVNLQIDPNTGVITGTVADGASMAGPTGNGIYNISVTISQPSSNPTTVNFTWTVSETFFAGQPLYRVNAGGPAITALDGGISWTADTEVSPSIYLENGNEHRASSYDPSKLAGLTNDLPSTTPTSIYETERWDPKASPEMLWAFPVSQNGEYEVRLYFGDIWGGSKNPGQRVFDIEIEGQQVATGFDVIDAFGDQIGGYQNYTVEVTDGVINIALNHNSGFDPLINGIEIIAASNMAEPITFQTVANQFEIEGNEVELSIQASGGVNTETFNYSANGLPPGLTINNTTGVISGIILPGAATGGPGGNGLYQAVITADKISSDPANLNIIWTVAATQFESQVLYRVNVGGNSIAALDGGLSWEEDSGDNPSSYLVNPFAHNTASFNPSALVSLDPELPSTTPASIYESERWDPNSAPDMEWAFPVPESGSYEVRLYFGDMFSGTEVSGDRVFDIYVEGEVIENNFDIIDAFGDQVGGYKTYTVEITDGTIDIFVDRISGSNAIMNGIEILAAPEVQGNDPEATVQLNPGAGLGASTFSANSILISNTGNVNIEKITFDISSSILADLVFDPNGTAGDDAVKCLVLDNQNGNVGYLNPNDACVDPFRVFQNGMDSQDGFLVMDLNFISFQPNESVGFSVDIDPTSIQGNTAAGEVGSISGFELIGSTVTIEFANGDTLTTTLWTDGSLGGSKAIVNKQAGTTAPVISLEGSETPVLVDEASQIINIQGAPNAELGLLRTEARLYLDTLGNGYDIDPFEANEALAREFIPVTLDENGSANVEVTLTRTAGVDSTKDGGLNHFLAVALDTSGATSLASNLLVMEFDPLAFCLPAGTLCGDGDSLIFNGIEDGICNCVGDSIVLALDTTNILSEKDSASFLVNVSANFNWTASKTAEWLNLIPSVDSANGTLTIELLENTTFFLRTDTVQVMSGGLVQNLVISQNGRIAELALSNDTLYFAREAGSQEISIASNADWTVIEDADWINPLVVKDSTNGTLTIEVISNETFEDRTVLLVVNAGMVSQNIFIQQAALIPNDPVCYLELDGQVSMEAEKFFAATIGVEDRAWTPYRDSTASDGIAMQVLGESVNQQNNTGGPRLDYKINFTTPGTYNIWVRTAADQASGANNSVHLGLNDTCYTCDGGFGVGLDDAEFRWTNDIGSAASDIQLEIPSPGEYIFNVWMREDGVKLDKIVLTQSANPITNLGPEESRVGECGLIFCPLAGTACDDGNPNTINDVEDGSCGCAGELITIASSVDSLIFNADSTSQAISIVSNSPVTILENADWIDITPYSDSTGANYLVTVLNNESFADRQDTIVLNSGASISDTIIITQRGVVQYITLEKDSLDFSAAGGTDSLNLSSNVIWIALKDVDWLAVSPSSDTLDALVTVTALANESVLPRTDTVLFSNGTITDTLIVSQAGIAPTLSLSTDSLDFTAVGGVDSLTVSTNVAWSIIEDIDWLEVSPISDSANAVVTITVLPNDTTIARVDTVLFTDGNLIDTLIVTQSDLVPFLTISTDSLSFNSNGGTDSITVSANIDWEVVENVDWIEVSPVSDSSDAVVNLSILPSTNLDARQDTVLIRNSRFGISDTLIVSQAAFLPFLTLSTDSLAFSSAGGADSIAVNSNVAWELIENIDWLEASPLSDSADAFVILTVQANDSAVARQDTLIFLADNLTDTLIVSQAAFLPFLALSTDSLAFSSAGGADSIAVNSNVAWELIENIDWLEASPLSDSADVFVTLTVQANDSSVARQDTLTFTSGDLRDTLIVTQEAFLPFLSLASDSITFTSVGGTDSIAVNSNVAWELTEDIDWLEVSPLSDSADAFVSLTVQANDSSVARQDTLIFTSGDLKDTLIVSQAAFAPFLTVAADSLNFTSAGGTDSIVVNSNVAWELTEDIDWLVVSPLSDSADAFVSLTVQANDSSVARRDTIIFTSGNLRDTLIVTQEGFTPFLSLSSDTISFTSVGGTDSIIVNSNVAWELVEDIDWLAVSPSSDSADVQITLSVQANTEFSPRTDTVIVRSGDLSDTLFVTQNGLSPSLTFSADSLIFTDLGGIDSLNLSSNVAWEILEQADWLSVIPLSDSSDATITLSVQTNTSFSARTDTVIVRSGDLSDTLIVVQNGLTPFLTLSADNLNFTDLGGTDSITVSSNVAWEVMEDIDWLSVSPTNDSLESTLTLIVQANNSFTSRTDTIVVKGGEFSDTILVSQNGIEPFLTLSANSLNFTNTGGTDSITVSTNVAWELIENIDWLDVSPMSDSSDATIIFLVQANPSLENRQDTVIFSSMDIQDTLIITQSGIAPSLSLSTDSLDFTEVGGTDSITVISNIAWEVIENIDWLAVNPISDSSDMTVTFTVQANPSLDSRQGTVIFLGMDVQDTLVITQSGVTPFLTLSNNSLDFMDAGGIDSITVSSNIAWEVVESIDWLSPSVLNDSASATVTFTIQANPSLESRSDTVQITDGALIETIVVNQAGIPAFLTVDVDTVNFSHTDSTIVLNVSSNTSWSVSKNANWLLASPAADSANGTITLTVSENIDLAVRNAILSIAYDNTSLDILVNQNGAPDIGGDCFVETSGELVIEAENYFSKADGLNRSWTVYSDADASAGLAMEVNGEGLTAGSSTNGPEMLYKINFTTPGVYNVWVRTASQGGNAANNSLHLGFDGACVSCSQGAGVGINRANLTWSREIRSVLVPVQIEVIDVGEHTFHVWMREDGVQIDKIYFTQSTNTPTGFGPDESRKGSCGSGSCPAAGTPCNDGDISTANDVTDGNCGCAGIPIILELSTASISVDAAQNEVTLDVTSNVDWTIIENEDWLSFSPANSTGNAQVTLTILENTNSSSRSSIVAFAVGEYLVNLNVNQDGALTGSGDCFVENNGELVIEAENYFSKGDAFGRTWTEYSEPDASGGIAMEVLGGGLNRQSNPDGPVLNYKVNFTTPGTYNVWVRSSARNGNSSNNSLQVGYDGNCITCAGRLGMENTSATPTWTNEVTDFTTNLTLEVNTIGEHTIQIWMREDGVRFDKIYLTHSSTVPTGFGPAESTQGSCNSSSLVNAGGFTAQSQAPTESLEQVTNTALINEFELTLYPNPTANDLTYQIPNGAQNHRLMIYDASGVMVLDQIISDKVSENTVDVSRLRLGVYQLIIIVDGQMISESFIKR